MAGAAGNGVADSDSAARALQMCQAPIDEPPEVVTTNSSNLSLFILQKYFQSKHLNHYPKRTTITLTVGYLYLWVLHVCQASL